MYDYDNIVSREIIKSLEEYRDLTLKWNKKINLISKNSIKEFWIRHIVDSLQLLQYINNKDIHLVDVGSGAGFPGIVLSIVGIKNVTLIESDVRKAAFLLQAAKISANRVEIINKRVENIQSSCDLLTTRAFAHLNIIFTYTRNIKVKNKYLLLKGENYQQEFEDIKNDWSFNCIIYNSITSKKSKILEISNLVKII